MKYSNAVCALIHPAQLPTPPRGHELGVLVLIFGAFDIYAKYLSRKNRMKNCAQSGGRQSGTVRFEKYIFFTLNSNIS